MRAFDWDPIRAEHWGQRPHQPHQQAEHVTAPDQCCSNAAVVDSLKALDPERPIREANISPKLQTSSKASLKAQRFLDAWCNAHMIWPTLMGMGPPRTAGRLMTPAGRKGVGRSYFAPTIAQEKANYGWAFAVIDDRKLARGSDVGRQPIGLLFWLFDRSNLVCLHSWHRCCPGRVACDP